MTNTDLVSGLRFISKTFSRQQSIHPSHNNGQSSGTPTRRSLPHQGKNLPRTHRLTTQGLERHCVQDPRTTSPLRPHDEQKGRNCFQKETLYGQARKAPRKGRLQGQKGRVQALHSQKSLATPTNSSVHLPDVATTN